MSEDVIITDDITIPAAQIVISSVRAQGAGGQNVNKVATAVHLRFDIAGSDALPDAVRERLLALRDRRITEDGVLIIKSQQHRTRERNRRAAIARLIEIVQSVIEDPRPRRKTRPSKKSRQQRLDDKRRRAEIKKGRSGVSDWKDT